MGHNHKIYVDENGRMSGSYEHTDAAGRRVGVYPVSENSWMDMGQIEELEAMRRKMENN